MGLKNSWVSLLVVSVILSSIIASGVTLVLLNTPQVREAFSGLSGQTSSYLSEFEQELLYYHLRYDNHYDSTGSQIGNLFMFSDVYAEKQNFMSYLNVTSFQYMPRLEFREFTTKSFKVNEPNGFVIDFNNEIIFTFFYPLTTNTTVYYWSPRGPIL
jgi:hypothetical protein